MMAQTQQSKDLEKEHQSMGSDVFANLLIAVKTMQQNRGP